MRVTFAARLFEGDVLLAHQWDAAIKATGLEDRDNYTGSIRPDRYFVGYLGEIAVAKMFDAFGIGYVHRVTLTGKSSQSEFMVSEASGGRVQIEVKTAGEPTHRELMYPSKQHDKKAAYLVGARIERSGPFHTDVSVLGWITREQADALPVSTVGHHTIPTCRMDLSATRPIVELLDRLANVRRITTA